MTNFTLTQPRYPGSVIPIFQVDAFTSRPFHGNPAAICPLESWLPDATMQAIAAENNLAETAFFVPQDGEFHIRWFTPEVEVDLCGHATLAAAYVIMNRLAANIGSVRFNSKSGPLTVTRQDDLYALDFPSRPPAPVEPHPALCQALGGAPRETLAARDYLVVYGAAEEVRALRSDMRLLKTVDRFAVIVTAPGGPGSGIDFVSRFFAPSKGIDEDPVTGSAHCTLIPYWSSRLGKTTLRALQVSPRGGELWVEHRGDRVTIAGHAVLFLEGHIHLP